MPAIHSGVRGAARNMLDAVGKQFSFHAKVWTGRGPDVKLTLKHVPLSYFNFKQGRFRFAPNGGEGNEINDEQWVICAQTFGVMEAVSVAALFKRLPLHQLIHVLQKWGIPSVYGTTTDTPGSPAWKELFAALQALRSGFTGILHGSAKIESAEPKSSTNLGNLQIKVVQEMDKAITKCWLGSHLGTSAESNTGTLAGGAQADDTADIIADDCDWLTEIFAEQITPDAILFGLGDAEPLARIIFELPDSLDDDGDLSRLERGVKLGARIPLAYLHDRFGWPVAEPGEDILTIAGTAGFGFSTPAKVPLRAPVASSCAVRRHPAAAVSRDLGNLYAASLQPIGNATATMLENVIGQIADAPNLAVALARADGANVATDDLGTVLAETAFAAIMRGYVPARPEIPAANSGGVFSRFRSALIGSPNAELELAPLPFDAAEEFWRAKRLVRSWDELGAATYEQAVAYGFKVAGITADSLLRQMHEDIERAIAGETSIDALITDLREKYLLKEKHAQVVARTNIQTAYHWGHYRQLTTPAVVQTFPIWAFDVVDDDDTSDICLALVGQAYPADSSIWDSLYPPNHYNCRTTVVALTSAEAAEQGFAVQTNAWPRDPSTGAEVIAGRGFEINVGRVANLADAVQG